MKPRETRNTLHAYGMKHPFTFGTMTLIGGLIIGFLIGQI